MQYRPFGKDRRSVSALGFGCMRLPGIDRTAAGQVDEHEAVRMIRRGIDAGINYLDTAKVYHEGQSEAVLGKALRDGYRDKVLIATKLPLWGRPTRQQCDRILREQLRDLGTDRIDVYLFHCLQATLWDTVVRNDLLDWIGEKKTEGKILRIGFSFHDDAGVFREILDGFDWDMCLLQYNYLCETMQAGTAGVRYAASRGVSVVVMEPLFGGALADPPGRVGEMFRESGYDPVDLALRWIWNKPEVSLLLSGMSNMAQVERNLEIANRSGVDALSEEENEFIAKIRREYEASAAIPCTQCKYCMPCPQGVDIPLNFVAHNHCVSLPETVAHHKGFYGVLPAEKRAGHCSRCGLCETKCPQKLPIRALLEKTHTLLS